MPLFYFKEMNNIPVLIDFDGVIKLGEKPAQDAGKFLKYLSDKKIPSYIISNSTLKTSEDILKFLSENEINFDVPAMTAADAALNFVKQHYQKVSVYCVESIKHNFKEFIDDENPQAVVIGDNGDNWSSEMMNEIFIKVMSGADLIAMHKNKYWLPDGNKSVLDAGAYIKAIEYASGKEAILIGKPSPVYFRTALSLLGFSADEEFFMIGDDIENDVNASQAIGGKGVLIYTGKTKYSVKDSFKQKPDLEIHSLSEMIPILERMKV
jgi:HAD superfamily hydrolase (TIGR01458 family)